MLIFVQLGFFVASDEVICETNVTSLYTKYHKRAKRSIFQLAGMIKCITGCDPMLYKGYGCYCGLHGQGVPVDVIDKKHDRCYDYSSCPHLLVYLMPYQWTCLRPGLGVCGTADYNSINEKCSYQLCECDRLFAQCIGQYECPRKKPECGISSMVYTFMGK
ncbi:uncharacterized protein B4U79_00777 [Dinothrombium tinctorium]|uniref:Phospholipase A2 n=1 Tax=Dinothrombium tinctorium TaxID=1965070 RepID=A0A443QVZ8_9ACAR|nr:uncharacterized protein B4U79_11631 [Dinothrombium tinctorium]RWS07214.1 uncharacterized protein B4U79_00777 [Dinothrombium tinctorium]